MLESVGELSFEFHSTDLSLRVEVLTSDSLSGSSYLLLIMELEGAELIPSHYLLSGSWGEGMDFFCLINGKPL